MSNTTYPVRTSVTQKPRAFALCIVVALVCHAAWLVPLEAQDNDVAARLLKIRADVSAGERSLAALKAEFKGLRTEEKSLTSEIDKLVFEEQALVERSTQVAREKESLLVLVRQAEQRVEQQQLKIRARLRSLYMHSADTSRDLVLAALHSADGERAAVYARAIRSHDERRFKEVTLAVEQLVDARQKLDVTLDEGQRVQAGIKLKRENLEVRRTTLQGVLRQIQDKQQKAKISLTALMKEAGKLEDILRSMTGGTGDDAVPAAVDRPGVIPRDQSDAPGEPVAPDVTPRSQAQQDAETPKALDRHARDVMPPDGLFGKAARIVAPVRGEVLQRFGKTKVTDFADMIFSKGFEYKTAEGSQVRAVLGGRVAFAGEMPGYDTVVIIDHGARSYSLYGRLGKSFVSTGDLIGQKDPLGVTGSPDERGRNFYFETRKNGAPVDPSGVLARAL